MPGLRAGLTATAWWNLFLESFLPAVQLDLTRNHVISGVACLALAACTSKRHLMITFDRKFDYEHKQSIDGSWLLAVNVRYSGWPSCMCGYKQEPGLASHKHCHKTHPRLYKHRDDKKTTVHHVMACTQRSATCSSPFSSNLPAPSASHALEGNTTARRALNNRLSVVNSGNSLQ